MSRLSRFSEREIDRLLAGRASSDEEEELAAFIRSLRASATKPLAEPLAARHLAAIAEAAQITATRTERRQLQRRRRTTVIAKRFAFLTATALVAALGVAGLAVAGVDLPDPADDAFDRVGIKLPNQANQSDTAEAVKAVIDSTAPQDRGCEFGQEVATAASGDDPTPDQDPCDNGNGQHGANAQGGGASDNAGIGRSFGEDTAADAKQNASEDGRAFDERTSEGARELREQLSQGGPETGQSNSQQGLSAEDVSGGRGP